VFSKGGLERGATLMRRKKCLICNSSDITKILDLGSHAYADTFIPKDKIYDRLDVYNLSCALCNSCGQVQTISKTNPKDRYSLYDYSYTSSNSRTSIAHWMNYADAVCEKLNIKKNNFVVEIGSNDGFLLKCFEDKGNKILGVDASNYVSKLASDRGVDTIVGLFDNKISEDVSKNYGFADLVVANNVFNHSDDPVSFANAANKLLRNAGHFVFELPYWKNSVDSQKIDQVYHEHVSYFTARSSKAIMEKCGFNIVDIEVVDYHGGSLRVYAQKKQDKTKHCEKLNVFIDKEQHLFNLETYKILNSDLIKKKNIINAKLLDLKLKGLPIIAIGAAAKGNTSLTFLSLNDTIIDYVTDTSVHKQNKFTPLTNIPIVDDDIISSYGEVYALILSWNLSEAIKGKLRKINSKIKFLEF
jgi:SAM-dependent methyltransferase